MPEETIGQKVIKRHGELKAVKDPFVDLWKTCTSLGYPMRNDWEGTAQTGRNSEVEIFDDTCKKALDMREDGIYGYHVSPAIKWFTARSGSRELRDNDDVKTWLQESDEGMYYAYSRSNFYSPSCIGSWLRDGDGIGLAVMFAEEIIGEGKIGFEVPHPRDIWVADDKYGNANLLHWKYKWTTMQIEEALEPSEIKKLSLSLQKVISEKEQVATKWEFLWVIWPNPNFIRGSIAKDRRKYITYLVQIDGSALIRTGGLDIFPSVRRVKKPSNLPYGRGLIGESLVSVNTSNQFSQVMMDAGELIVNPAWWIPKEAKASFDRAPGGENYYTDPNKDIRPLNQNIKFPWGVEERKYFQELVRENFRTDYFSQLSRAAMEGRELTVPQVIEMQGEKAALMGSELGSLNTDLDQIHDKVFDIEMKAGRLPPPPQIVLDMMMAEQQATGKIEQSNRIEIDYIGPLAQAQKRLFKTEGILHSIDSLRPLVELQVAANKPVTVLDRLDEDETVQELMEAHGMPQKLMRSDEEVEEIQQIRAQEQQAREAAEMALEAAKAAPGVSGKVDEESVLAGITG